MKLSWKTEIRDTGSFTTIRGGSGALVGAAWLSAGDPPRYLVPVRITTDGRDAETWLAASEPELARQSANLVEKLGAIDRLGLSDVQFGTAFGSGRVFLRGSDDHVDELWDTARHVLDGLRARCPVPIHSQLDYDQQRKHPDLGGLLDNVDLRTRHDPSAIATTVGLTRLLRAQDRELGSTSVSIRGVGELGRRIVDRLVEAGVGTIYVFDRDPSRMESATKATGVEATSEEELTRLPVEAHLMAADTGSLSVDVAQKLRDAGSVAVAGGPEAGLDRATDAIDILAGSGITYLPSVLCGSMGLTANLEEIMGLRTDLIDQSRRLGRFIDSVIRAATQTGRPFHEALLGALR